MSTESYRPNAKRYALSLSLTWSKGIFCLSLAHLTVFDRAHESLHRLHKLLTFTLCLFFFLKRLAECWQGCADSIRSISLQSAKQIHSPSRLFNTVGTVKSVSLQLNFCLRCEASISPYICFMIWEEFLVLQWRLPTWHLKMSLLPQLSAVLFDIWMNTTYLWWSHWLLSHLSVRLFMQPKLCVFTQSLSICM